MRINVQGLIVCCGLEDNFVRAAQALSEGIESALLQLHTTAGTYASALKVGYFRERPRNIKPNYAHDATPAGGVEPLPGEPVGYTTTTDTRS